MEQICSHSFEKNADLLIKLFRIVELETKQAKFPELSIESPKRQTSVNFFQSPPSYPTAFGEKSPPRKQFNHIGLLEEVSEETHT